jgi:hypothetical protein
MCVNSNKLAKSLTSQNQQKKKHSYQTWNPHTNARAHPHK